MVAVYYMRSSSSEFCGDDAFLPIYTTCAYDKRIQGDDGSTHHGKKGKLGMR